jgi:hypothetical protein
MSYDPGSRFYVDKVTGFSESNGGSPTREKTLWYVFDSVPPRQSFFQGWGEIGRKAAEETAAIWNRAEADWWTRLQGAG